MMKRNTIYACVWSCLATFAIQAQDEAKLDSVQMGPGYGNEVYYKFDGTKSEKPVADWHIGFTTSQFSQTVFVNVGAKVVVANVPDKKVEDFESFGIEDTTGFSNWDKLYNDSITFGGAFDQKVMEEFPYGWGKYTGAPAHKVVGGPLYLLNFTTGSGEDAVVHFVKVAIDELDKGTYTIRYAELKPTGTTTVTKKVEASTYSSKNLVFFNVLDGAVKDRELENWDLWAVQYHDKFGTATTTQAVTGILHNPKYDVAKVEVGAGNQATHSDHASATFSGKKNVIGQHYKYINYQTLIWTVTDSTVYYLKDTTTKDVWKWYPTKFESGSGQNGTGKTVFMIQKVYTAPQEPEEGDNKDKDKDKTPNAGIEDLSTSFVDIYPNPVNNQMTIVFDSKATSADIILKNQLGQVVFIDQPNTNSGIYSQKIDMSALNSGMYFVEIIQNGIPTVKTVIKN